MNKRNLIVFSFFLILGFVLVLLFSFSNSNNLQSKETLNVRVLREEIETLFKKQYTIPLLRIHKLEEIDHIINSSMKKDTLRESHARNEDFILRFTLKDRRIVEIDVLHDAPGIVLKEAIKTLNSIEFQKIAPHIKFLEIYYDPKLFLDMSTGKATILISIEEFNKLHEELRIQGLSEEEILEELSAHYKSKANFGG